MVIRKAGVKALIALVLATTALSACAPRVAVRGNLPREEQLAKIVVGEQKREDVIEILGSPSTLGVFDDKIWYYISRRTEKLAFFDEEIVDQQVVAIYFDDKNTVQAIQKYDRDDLRDIGMVERETPTSGNELSVLEQLLGNLGRFGKTPSQ
ncbi:MAG: outer membrane protein assembly factor BamE [Proteobacteria bacterium]|nr:outer membrane protein assembly factor BamE [Pseudomonadota bacterium]